MESSIQARVVSQRVEAERAAAQEIAELVRSRRASGRSTCLGLATGSSQIGVYRELARLYREGLDLSGIVTFNLDEYAGVRPAHPASCRAFMTAHFLRHVNVRPENVYFPGEEGEGTSPAAFEARIRDAGGIDLQLLGIGRNGHIAFNEPGSAPDSRTRRVTLAEATRLDAAPSFANEGRVPTHAVTMGIATILEAARIRLLAFGASKAAAVHCALHAAPGSETPASYLHLHSDVVFWLDPEAAADLARSPSP